MMMMMMMKTDDNDDDDYDDYDDDDDDVATPQIYALKYSVVKEIKLFQHQNHCHNNYICHKLNNFIILVVTIA